MTSRRRWVAAAHRARPSSAIAALAIAFDPSVRFGMVCGEPFFQGRAATAWSRHLANPDAMQSNHGRRRHWRPGRGVAAGLRLAHAARGRIAGPHAGRRGDRQDGKGRCAGRTGPGRGAEPSRSRSSAPGGQSADSPRTCPTRSPLSSNASRIARPFVVAEFKQAARDAVPNLIEMTRNPDAAVRRQAVRALGKIGAASLDALPDLIALTTSDPAAGGPRTERGSDRRDRTRRRRGNPGPREAPRRPEREGAPRCGPVARANEPNREGIAQRRSVADE